MTQPEVARRNAEVVRLALAGTPPREIEIALGCKRHTVYDTLKQARARGVPVPRFPSTGARRTGETAIRLPPDPRLLRAARARAA